MEELKPSEQWRKDTYIPYENRKKILLLSDDLRLPSGVGTVSRDIILHTIHHFNWVQVGGAIKHPEQGKIVDMSHEIKKMIGLEQSYMRIYPINGYGDPDLIRYLIQNEKVDAIMHFTDPRFWIWLYQMEHEIRQYCPILFYHVWDDLPFPMYNQDFYESCDTIACISKQTYNIVKNVRQRKPITKDELKYIPHGIDEVAFKPLTIENPGDTLNKKDKQGKEYTKTEFEEMLDFKKKLFGGRDYEFSILYNNRNIRRKMTGDVILAFSEFVKTLPEDDREKVVLIMHTAVVDNNGTDLAAVKNAVAPKCHVIFSNNKLDQKNMMYLYNIADVTINIASNEGFGLSSAESLMCGTPIINNITGGLQDQVGLKDEKGKYLDSDEHYNADWGSNHDGRYKECGEWAYSVFPSNRALVGSPPTPYIFDDRCKFEDAAVAMRYWYDKGDEKRAKAGQTGREFLFEMGMTARKMGFNFIDYINSSINNWKPRTRFSIHTV